MSVHVWQALESLFLHRAQKGCWLTCNFIRFRRAPVPTLMILVANSTPIVCDDSTLHSFFTKRCSKHDLPVPLGPSNMIFAR